MRFKSLAIKLDCGCGSKNLASPRKARSTPHIGSVPPRVPQRRATPDINHSFVTHEYSVLLGQSKRTVNMSNIAGQARFEHGTSDPITV